jgi:hypothetical protein
MSENPESNTPANSGNMPDWKCSFCGALNPAHCLSCQGCKKTRVESDDNYFNMIATPEQKTLFPHPALLKQTFFHSFKDLWDALKTKKYFWHTVALSTLLLAGLAMLASRREKVEYRVVEAKWERTLIFKPKTKGTERVFRLEGRDNFPRWPDPAFAKNTSTNWDKTPRRLEKYSVLLEAVDSQKKTPRLVTIIPSSEEFEKSFLIGKNISLKIEKDGTLIPPSETAPFKK